MKPILVYQKDSLQCTRVRNKATREKNGSGRMLCLAHGGGLLSTTVISSKLEKHAASHMSCGRRCCITEAEAEAGIRKRREGGETIVPENISTGTSGGWWRPQ